jgi:hypothetical protein
MRMADVLQLLKNVTSNVTIKLDGKTMFPSIELSGKGLLELHGDSIWVAGIVGDGFLKPRILWEDFAHEFKFVEPAKRGVVCRDALMNAAAALKQGRGQGQVTGRTSAQFAIVDLLVAAEATLEVASREMVVERDDYNRWVLGTGGGNEEKMSEDEHLASLVETVRNVRLKTLPIWSSLIDLLPDGATKAQADEKLRSGYKTVGLDGLDTMPDWQVVSEQKS